ncbi:MULTISPECIES: hypothetical protein [unclassified Leptolyngbya]|uniref:hypothetical protein n=1 Tax=unclassified Leptolyngbya TaxID=2650499 RepID=UPI001687045C|nr:MULTISPECIES: hypothetical protein [unclassified Leptolyngbya]MBD1909323.1 hypothetical protein [Leptolyngbya sp. FACHB-8]MBD2158181.1 hypothetical protein [Leptolyngbya sp. FACHB-16]
MDSSSPLDWDEMFEYLPGTLVELVERPGVFYEIECYEAMMVPPIWLKGDSRPRYPHSLRIVSRKTVQACELEPTLVHTASS